MTNYLKTNFDYNSEELIEVFDELPLWAAPFGLKLLDYINYRKGITAIDIGFGAGFPLTELAMRLGNSCKVYGLDPWEAAIKRAEKKIGFFNIKNTEIIKGVAEDIPLEDDTVDLIVSNNGLNNVSDLNKSLSECNRIIKEGGQFIQTINLNRSMIEFYTVMEIVLKELNMNDSLELMNEQIYKKRKPLDVFTSLIEKNGFKINKVLHDKFDYQFVDGTTMLNHYFIRLAFMDGWKNIIPKNQQIELFEKMEHIMNKQVDIEGVFKLNIPFVLIDCSKQ